MREFFLGTGLTIGLVAVALLGLALLILISSKPWAPMLAMLIVGYAIGTVFGPRR